MTIALLLLIVAMVAVSTTIIMSKISEFAANQATHNTAIDTAIDGLTADVKFLSDKITELQNSQGTISPEDQALLDQLEAKTASIADKLGALDAVTNEPPVVPVTT